MNVTELNNYVKGYLEEDPLLNNLLITGELSGYKRHSSGHIYFTLKDESAAVRCAFFKPYSLYADKSLKDGDHVCVYGRVVLFERDGQYQLNITYVKKVGHGNLYLQYEMLKKKLLDEGLFDDDYKKPIPRYVKKIGVVTSPTGAAFRDIVNVSTRRCPLIQILLAPVTVQGEDAPRSICTGIRALDEREDVDLIIVGRGGGSVEDLWSFNDEAVARAIFNCSKPVISAVGHETDFSISDFVADMRAPTPSAAAEIAVFDYYNTVSDINYFENALFKNIRNIYSEYHLKLLEYSRSFTDPEYLIEKMKQKTELLEIRMLEAVKKDDEKNQLAMLSSKLDALSPLKVLSRGYSVVKDKDGKVIKNSSQVQKGEKISITLSEGEINAEVQ